MYRINLAARFAAKSTCDSELSSASHRGDASTESINSSPNSRRKPDQRVQGLRTASRQLFLLFASALLCTTIVSEAHAISPGCNAASGTTINSGNSGSLATNLVFDDGDTIQITTSSGNFTASVTGANIGTITPSTTNKSLFLQHDGVTSISV